MSLCDLSYISFEPTAAQAGLRVYPALGMFFLLTMLCLVFNLLLNSLVRSGFYFGWTVFYFFFIGVLANVQAIFDINEISATSAW